MKFLLTQFFILFSSVTFLIYMLSLDYFVPYTSPQSINWYNTSLILFLLFATTQSFVSLIVFLFQKFLAYGWREFPDYKVSLRWGNILGISLVGGVFLNILGILVFPWGSLALLLVIILITVI
ncbi:MAG: hypothetical protein UT34_C0001G0533 [candidate division WS6 bacterium GW2011_GWF2_39_15]|uniref:Uncharacterized protein n=1 Tax=candidate division WS6 bacterium GW2011_GWF2_39_15 TaxID=1619100 RepID=A0A0G0QXX1_9BACT|nr:MAG: hypothetical protein UT34_C0001G0533 [candidate division WS6 bacterium GW2011_GWF2_39_15]